MPRNKAVFKSDFFCTCCGSKGIPIARIAGYNKEPGHLKKLYCLKCKKETNHVEIRPYGSYRYEDFLEEYNLGRFYDGKRIKVADLMKCSKTNCPCNKNGRCWNSNYSYDCGHRPLKTEEELKEEFKDA